MTRQMAVSSDVAAAVSGVLVVVETANSGTAPASASSPPMMRPGPTSRGSTAASPRASVGGTARGAPSGGQDREQRRRDCAGDDCRGEHPIGVDGDVGWGDAVAHERVSECPAEHDPGPDTRRGAHQGDDRRLPRDHAANLAGRRGDRAQQRDLALALLDREPHGAGHDEHRDEHSESGERCRDGDQRRACLLKLGILAAAARIPGQHHRAGGGGAQARNIDAGAGQHTDRVDPSGMARQPRCLRVGQEDRGL